MNREQAAQLTEDYFGGWINEDLERFLSTLSEDVVIVECDGTAYRGVDEARRWFADWHADPVNDRVTDWTILEISFDELNGVATVEWDFACVCHGEASSFLGASARSRTATESRSCWGRCTFTKRMSNRLTELPRCLSLA